MKGKIGVSMGMDAGGAKEYWRRIERARQRVRNRKKSALKPETVARIVVVKKPL